MKQSTNSLKSAHNTDFFGEKLAKIRQILPEIFSENRLDIDKIKTLLGEHIAQNERYGLNWAGKSAAYQALQRPTNNTLTPCLAESVDFEITQNIFIESDNLEALKILQKSYAGKIKMIYIDPPYNTGNDFIYHDDFSQTKTEYEIATGDRDVNGKLLKSFKKNSKDNGRYHSNWLNMMLPRLHLARTLLADDGVIFISIDDNEQAQLKLLCDEIFGGENVEVMVWRKSGIGRDGKMKNTTTFRNDHEYIITVFKNIKLLKKSFEKPNWINSYDNPDNDPRGNYKAGSISKKEDASNPNHQFYYTVTSPSGKKFTRQFDVSFDDFNKLDKDNRIYWGKNLDSVPAQKIFENEERIVTTSSLIDDGQATTTQGSKELESIIDIDDFGKVMRPKPLLLLKKLIQIGTNENDIIMDFFAGSSTTANSILEFNADRENSYRKFIMVQLPEILDINNASTAEGKKIIQNAIDFCNENNLPTNIAEISKERIRRAGAKIKADNPAKNLDVGFKVFKLSDSNFKTWQVDDDNIADQLEMYIDPLVENAKEIDIVYELLLKMGLKLTADIEFKDGVYWLTCENKLYAIVLNSLSQDDFNTIITKKPTKTVVLDKVFLNDSEKSNVILQFKDVSLNFESI